MEWLSERAIITRVAARKRTAATSNAISIPTSGCTPAEESATASAMKITAQIRNRECLRARRQCRASPRSDVPLLPAAMGAPRLRACLSYEHAASAWGCLQRHDAADG